MKKYILFSCLMLSINTYGNIELEPYLGLGYVHSTHDHYPVPTSGFVAQSVGARAGLSYLNFGAGIDYERLQYSRFHHSSISFYGKVAFPMLFKLWGEHYIHAGLDHQNQKGSYSLRSASSLGVGLLFIPAISLNFEWQKKQYMLEDISPHQDSDYQMINYLFTISFPLEF